jgi:RNA recognition motif-containing protein
MNIPILLVALAPTHARGLVFLAAVLLGIVLFFVVKAARARGGRPAKSRPAAGNGEFVEIYVGNLSYDMTDEQLRALFAKYGVVQSGRVITHKPTGRSKGFGFVEMPHRAEAEIAISKINNTDVMGRRIRCNEAREDSRPDR